MTNESDRRFYERIHLLAYATDKFCQLACVRGNLRASLVDIGNGGARVRLDQPLAMERGFALRFSLGGSGATALLQNLEATVRWQAGQDMGLRFETPLGLPLKTLQDMIA